MKNKEETKNFISFCADQPISGNGKWWMNSGNIRKSSSYQINPVLTSFYAGRMRVTLAPHPLTEGEVPGIVTIGLSKNNKEINNQYLELVSDIEGGEFILDPTILYTEKDTIGIWVHLKNVPNEIIVSVGLDIS